MPRYTPSEAGEGVGLGAQSATITGTKIQYRGASHTPQFPPSERARRDSVSSCASFGVDLVAGKPQEFGAPCNIDKKSPT